MVRRRPFSDAPFSCIRLLAGASLATSTLALVAACGGSSSPAPLPTPAPSSASPTAASSGAATTAPTSAPTSAPTAAPTATATAAGPTSCQSIHLALQAGASQGAAGSTIATFILRNAGTAPCTLYGFPGVSFLDSAGAQVGSAATRQGTASAQFIVQPGQVASFQVQIAIAGCAPSSTQSTTIRVYPPNQKDALQVPASFPICTTPSVSAVKSGVTQ